MDSAAGTACEQNGLKISAAPPTARSRANDDWRARLGRAGDPVRPLMRANDDHFKTMIESRKIFKQYVSDITLQGIDISFVVLSIGIDHLADINEVFGYEVGDEVLSLVRGRLRSALRDTDRLVSLPGDECVLLLRSTSSLKEIHTVTDRLKNLLQRPYLIRGKIFNISACIGVVAVSRSGTTSEVLLQRASIALRWAKMLGAGTIHFFESAMEDTRAARQALTADLRNALLLWLPKHLTNCMIVVCGWPWMTSAPATLLSVNWRSCPSTPSRLTSHSLAKAKNRKLS